MLVGQPLGHFGMPKTSKMMGLNIELKDLPFMGMTGVFEFFLVPSYQWHFEKRRSSGELASAMSEEKMFDLRLDEQRHSIFLCRNGGFG